MYICVCFIRNISNIQHCRNLIVLKLSLSNACHLLAMFTLSGVKSSTQAFIHNAILSIDTSIADTSKLIG